MHKSSERPRAFLFAWHTRGSNRILMEKLMHKALWSLFALMPSLVLAGSLEQLDAEMGFLGLVFGTRVERVGGLTFVENRSNLQVYAPKQGALHQGKIGISKVLFGFNEGRLSTIWLETSELAASSGLYRHLVERYGEPSREVHRPYVRHWNGQRNQISFEVLSDDGRSEVQITGQMRAMQLLEQTMQFPRLNFSGQKGPSRSLDPTQEKMQPQEDKYGYFSGEDALGAVPQASDSNEP